MAKQKAVLPKEYMRYKSQVFPAYLLCGDCVAVMKAMSEGGFKDQIDAVVTDPPYGIDWLGSDWDRYDRRTDEQRRADAVESGDYELGFGYVRAEASQGARPTTFREAGRSFQAWCEEWAKATFDLLKPGGFILSFGGSRSHHRMVCGLENAGYEIRDEIQWVYSSGMLRGSNLGVKGESIDLTEGQRETLEGKGTALKPAHEPIAVGRKPLPLGVSVADHVAASGVGALNIEGSRFVEPSFRERPEAAAPGGGDRKAAGVTRYPANVVVAEEAPVLAEATKFFYCPKPSAKERGGTIGGAGGEKAVKDYAEGREIEAHPTTKPIRLMSWLVGLVTPAGGIVLDPFMGSGTTVIAAAQGGYRAIGIELDERFTRLAIRRLQAVE